MPPFAQKPHDGVVVIRCTACGHAFVAEFQPLHSRCPVCGSGTLRPVRHEGILIRLERKAAIEVARALCEHRDLEAYAMIRKEENSWKVRKRMSARSG